MADQPWAHDGAHAQAELPLLHYTDGEGHRYAADLLDLAAEGQTADPSAEQP